MHIVYVSNLMLLQNVWLQGTLGYVLQLDPCVIFSVVSWNICHSLHAEGAAVVPRLDV